MTAQTISVLIYGAYLFLPGFLIALTLNYYRNRFLLSYGISISLIVLTLPLVLWLGYGAFFWIGLHFSFFTLFLLVAHINSRQRFRKRNFSKRQRPRLHFLPIVVCTLLLFCFTAYYVFVGPYTEIPSDFWKHLARVEIESTALVGGTLGRHNNEGFILTAHNPVYVFHGAVAYFFSTKPIHLVPTVSFVTSAIFLVSIYWFSLKLFSVFRLNDRYKVVAASLATILTFVSFGTASFSFVRYYAYFPTIIAFPLIYAVLSIFIDYLNRPHIRITQLILIPVFLLAMLLIHRQEALLTFIMMCGISFVRAGRSLSPMAAIGPALLARARSSALFFLALLALITVYAFTAREIAPWGPPHVIDIGALFPLFAGIPLDNPSFRFWDTLGFFGLLVYAWSVLRWKSLSRSDFLTTGMLVPLFTNLNPLYAIIFLHYDSSTVLWRTAYLMPLSMVAALLMTLSFARATAGNSLRMHASFVTAIVLLALSLIPIQTGNIYNRHSRIPSLMSVNQVSGAGLWADLIDAVDEIQKNHIVRRIITDEITKFVLYTSTRGEIWWWPDHDYFPKYKDNYREDFLSSDYTSSLLVINRRNGKQTLSAQYAGHWPPDVLKVSRHYPKDIHNFIKEYPSVFELLWTNNNIWVYMLHSHIK